MNKFLYVLLIFSSFAFSQTREEMISAGIKPKVIDRIEEKFDGSLSMAINHWADNGNGKLSKKLVESSIKLGYNEVWLNQKLKLARNIRGAIIGGALMVTGAAIAASGGGYGGSGYTGDYANYYSNPQLDVSKTNKTFEIPEYEPLDFSKYNNYSNSTSNLPDVTSRSTQYDYSSPFQSSIYQADEEKTTYGVTPLIFGNANTYINGQNSVNTGFDDAGTLNIYDSSGITIGAIKEEDNGYSIYDNGNLVSFTSKPDNEGVSTTYVKGVATGAQKYDSDGNISIFNGNGQLIGYSKKVKGGYENYDSNGHITSFTNLEDKRYNPLDGIKVPK